MGYTVILVEDEKIVRDELAASIGWERLGLTLGRHRRRMALKAKR
jgi:hypothetical protein